MASRFATFIFSTAIALPLLAAPGFTAGGGGSGGGSSGGSSGNSGEGSDNASTQCKHGRVWDNRQQKCVEPKQGMLDDQNIYEAGRALAKAGRYAEAITVLSLADNKNDWRILNYLGYSHRKLGRVEVGLGYYQEALMADPENTLVREYMGEAYLQLGELATARRILGEIQIRCGTSCEEYTALDRQITAFEVKG